MHHVSLILLVYFQCALLFFFYKCGFLTCFHVCAIETPGFGETRNFIYSSQLAFLTNSLVYSEVHLIIHTPNFALRRNEKSICPSFRYQVITKDYTDTLHPLVAIESWPLLENIDHSVRCDTPMIICIDLHCWRRIQFVPQGF